VPNSFNPILTVVFDLLEKSPRAQEVPIHFFSPSPIPVRHSIRINPPFKLSIPSHLIIRNKQEEVLHHLRIEHQALHPGRDSIKCYNFTYLK